MKRLVLVALSVTLIPWASRGEEKPNTVRVTGTVILPKGAKLPRGAVVSVSIYFYQTSGNVRYYSRIGYHSFKPADASKPPEFSVAVPRSYPEEHDAGAFLMRAAVLVQEGDRTVTLYASTKEDAVVPFTGEGKPKTNVRLRVSKED